jgi:hypothetical protein
VNKSEENSSNLLLGAKRDHAVARAMLAKSQLNMGLAIKTACDRNSQKTVADLLKVSPQHINDVINGRRELSNTVIDRIIYAITKDLK